MACRTASVERIADKSIAAKKQLEKLLDDISLQKEKYKTVFEQNVTKHLASANITDAVEIDYNDYIKTEYTSEFSLDKIVAVVKDSLEAIVASQGLQLAQALVTPGTIDAYSDLVTSIAEAAKTSSATATSLSFSKNRLHPGLIAFISAISISMKDKETFGEESVTSTIVYYKVISSKSDLLTGIAVTMILIDTQTLLQFKKLQAALVDALANDTLTLEEYLKKDEIYSDRVAKLEQKIKQYGQPIPGPSQIAPTVKKDNKFSAALPLPKNVSREQLVVSMAIEALQDRGGDYSAVIQKAQERIKANYYNSHLNYA
ncbi:hypothetical protein AM493_01100 [Flavobacterium akiainvivens]|uniref:Uncharacterized protein n=1 Tax=Flavobacterium akiainvivens TaxID=1202724 RepID=A0A0M8M8L5_9FLAO|nr:hypothetical protein [Flavobacterium akiainvivens]KOS04795.1 hypothetical protein AM493_01100 [Flavobacterium akiainvivens]SFQ66199.1 hypothetical protein SAMN05444144_1131 [Flavobacterium akiainvivens]